MFWLCQSIHATSPEGTQAPESFQCDSRLVISCEERGKICATTGNCTEARACPLYSILQRACWYSGSGQSIRWSRLCFFRDAGSELNNTVYSRFVAQARINVISSNIPLRGRVDVNATSCACWGRSPNCGICLENVSGLKEYLAFCFENSLNRGQSFSFFFCSFLPVRR